MKYKCELRVMLCSVTGQKWSLVKSRCKIQVVIFSPCYLKSAGKKGRPLKSVSLSKVSIKKGKNVNKSWAGKVLNWFPKGRDSLSSQSLPFTPRTIFLLELGRYRVNRSNPLEEDFIAFLLKHSIKGFCQRNHAGKRRKMIKISNS